MYYVQDNSWLNNICLDNNWLESSQQFYLLIVYKNCTFVSPDYFWQSIRQKEHGLSLQNAWFIMTFLLCHSIPLSNPWFLIRLKLFCPFLPCYILAMALHAIWMQYILRFYFPTVMSFSIWSLQCVYRLFL